VFLFINGYHPQKAKYMLTQTKKVFIVFSALLAWFALILQFKLSLTLLQGNYIATIKLFISFFTVTTNILVAICFTVLWLFPNSNIGRFFSKSTTITAVTVYIMVVGLIYNFLLRGLVLQSGWAKVADELLHVVTPFLVLIFWMFYANKSGLKYSNALKWLIYPMGYIIFIVIRGYLINQYPYPFINVAELGYPKAILNAVLIVVFFWLLSVLFIFAGKKVSKT